MVSIDRKALFGKLNKLCYESIEGAFKFCTMRGNSHIEIAHWLHQIFQQQDSDLHRLIKHFGIDETRLSKDLLEALDKLPSGASSSPNISAHILEQLLLISSVLIFLNSPDILIKLSCSDLVSNIPKIR